MSVLAIRHGLSLANDRNSLAFAAGEAPLMEEGKQQARHLGSVLGEVHGIKVAEAPVAVSELRRSQETAHEAGFKTLVVKSSLNELMHDMDRTGFRNMIAAGRLPSIATEGAQALLEDPPDEQIWITHGLVIAGLCQILGVARNERLIPRFCEIRTLPLE
jgi:hypothetical protein